MMIGDDWKDIMCGNKAGSGGYNISREVLLYYSCYVLLISFSYCTVEESQEL